MANINIGKGLQGLFKGAAETVQGAADNVRKTVKDVKLPDVKLPEVKLPEVKLPDVKPDQLLSVFSKKSDSAQHEGTVTNIPIQHALHVIYFLMNADGIITPNEADNFNAIGAELDPDFSEHKAKILNDCNAHMSQSDNSEDRYDLLLDGIGDALRSSPTDKDIAVAPRLLVWDLLTIAYSDGSIGEAEQKLVKYVVRKLNIDKAIYLEMESSLLAILDLNREEDWIKTTDRPYRTIEAQVTEIAGRRKAIFNSVLDLINL